MKMICYPVMVVWGLPGEVNIGRNWHAHNYSVIADEEACGKTTVIIWMTDIYGAWCNHTQ